MLEPRRSHYLRALGIDVYMPRFILPGAAVSQPSVWEDDGGDSAETDSPETDSAEAAAAFEATSAVETAQAAEIDPAVADSSVLNTVATAVGEVAATVRQRSLPANLDIASAIATRPTARRSGNSDEQRVNEQAQTAAAAMPTFALSVTVSAGILIIDSAPPNSGARSEYLKLLGNILAALHTQPAQPQLDIFLWPAVKHPQLDQGADAARETLAAHLQKQIQQHAIDTVLVLGATAQQWCEGALNDNLRWVTSVSALACLREPQNKRQLWQDIRHLAAAR